MKKVKSLIFLFLLFLIILSSYNVSKASIIGDLIARLISKKNQTSVESKENNINSIEIIDENDKDVEEAGSFLKNTSISTQLLKRYLYESGEVSIQGSCTDGKYIYVSTISKIGNSSPYLNQSTKILIIDFSTGNIVKRVSLGKIGHSNALTYNPKNKTIIISTCSSEMNYIYIVNTSELLKLNSPRVTRIYLRDKNNKLFLDKKNISTVSYNTGRNEYLVVWNNARIAVFNENFKLKRVIDLNEQLNNNSSITGQSIYCDSSYIYYVCNKITSNFTNNINYIKVYNYNGNLIRKATITNTGAEFESIFAHHGKYYILSNSLEINNGAKKYYIKVYRLNLRDSNKYEISIIDEDNQNIDNSTKNKTTKYRTMILDRTSKITNIDFNKTGKTLYGYKLYRDYNNSWYINIDGINKWLTFDQIREAKQKGKKIKYAICRTETKIKNLTKGGDSVLMVAVWE